MIHRTEWVKKQMLFWGGKLDYTKDKESKTCFKNKIKNNNNFRING